MINNLHKITIVLVISIIALNISFGQLPRTIKFYSEPKNILIFEDDVFQFLAGNRVNVSFKNSRILTIYKEGYIPQFINLHSDSLFKKLNIVLKKIPEINPFHKIDIKCSCVFNDNNSSNNYCHFLETIISESNQKLKSKKITVNSTVNLSAKISIRKMDNKLGHITIEWESRSSEYGDTKKIQTNSVYYGEGVKHVSQGILVATHLFFSKPVVKETFVDKTNTQTITPNISIPKIFIDTIKIPDQNYTRSEVLKGAISSTITITTENSLGSGFFISNDGYILTNYHVIEGNKNINAILSTGIELPLEIIRHNEEKDVALLKMRNGKSFSPFSLSLKKSPDLGDDVIAIGTPKSIALGQTITKGIVSGRRIGEGFSYIQTDVSISPGNSGGPLILTNGQVVGIVSAKYIGGGSEGLGFAIPIAEALKALNIEVE